MSGFDPDIFGAPPEKSQGFDASIFSTPEAPKAPAQLAKKQGTGSELLDAGNALGTGYFRSLTRLAGLPADTVANVLDLGKAAIGAPYIAATGKEPPKWLQISDRKNVVGSGDYLVDKLRSTNAGRGLIDPANPDYEGGYTQLAGGGLAGVMSPNTWQQGVNQGINAVGSAGLGKLTYDVTGSPELAIAASMAPTGVQKYGTDAIQAAVRGGGGEAKRRQMEQRIQDLKNAGIDNPTLGLASGNKLIGGMENLLQSTPGAVNIMAKAREKSLTGLQNNLQEAADLASPVRGALESGVAIQSGIKNFKDQFKEQQGALYNRMDKDIPPLTPVNVANTKQTLASLNAEIPGAPEISKQFVNSRIKELQRAFEADTVGPRPGVMVTQTGSGDLMNSPITKNVPIPGGSTTDLLPFQAVKQTRTLVGGEIADNSIMSSVPRSKWNPLYGALSGDMQQAAAAAGPAAIKSFDRATDYTRAGLGRLERIAPFANTAAPEQAFNMLAQTAKGNVSTLQAVKKSLPDDARGTIAGTIIDKLGQAKAGQQNDSGSAWSPETFLTNYNNITPQGRAEMFSGFKNAAEVRASVDQVARATSMMRESSKMWANPSGTAANVAARGILGSVGVGGVAAGMGLLNPMVPIAAAGGLLGTNLLARGLTSQRVVNGMAARNYLDPELLQGQFNSLMGGGLLEQR